MAVTCLRRSLVGLSQCRSKFNPMQVHLRFEEYKVAMEEISFRVLRVFCQHYSTIFHVNSTFIRRPKGDTWKHSNREILFLILGSMLYHGSGGYQPTSHREDLGSITDQSTKNFWRTKHALGQVCLQVNRFSNVRIIPSHISSCCCYQKDERDKLGKPQIKQHSPRNQKRSFFKFSGFKDLKCVDDFAKNIIKIRIHPNGINWACYS